MNTPKQPTSRTVSNHHPVIDFTDLSQWKTLDEVEEEFPKFKKGTLRWLIRKKSLNGLDKVIKRVGQLNYVHVGAFSVWISQQ